MTVSIPSNRSVLKLVSYNTISIYIYIHIFFTFSVKIIFMIINHTQFTAIYKF